MSESEIPQEGAPDYEGELARLRMRVADAELRAEGARAGMRDLDALKMLSDEDRQAAAQDDSGAAKAVTKLRKEKPWLFTSSTSAAARAPAAVALAPVNAMTMSHEEWRSARAALLRKQGFRGS
jgi:hypothetical protein